MKTFHIPIEIKLCGTVAVEAENEEEAFDKADTAMYWAYQNGDPSQGKGVSITDTEIEVEGKELDLDI